MKEERALKKPPEEKQDDSQGYQEGANDTKDVISPEIQEKENNGSIMEVPEEGESNRTAGQRKLTGFHAKVVFWGAAAMSMYHLIIAFVGMPEPFRLRRDRFRFCVNLQSDVR